MRDEEGRLMYAIQLRRSTVLADARGGATLALDDERPEQPEPTEVRAGGSVASVAGGVVWLVAAAVEGTFAYALYTGKWIFTSRHPVWGTIFALFTMSNLYAGAEQITRSDS